MADVVTTQILENGPRFIVVKFTNLSDGTGETDVVKIDATLTGPYGVTVQGQQFFPGVHLKLVDLKYSVFSMGLRIQWVGSPNNEDMLVLQATDHWQMLDERGGFGGLTVPAGLAGVTGSIAFTTVGAGSGSGYTIIMKLVKGVPQS
jgi:hypothetical protein